VKWLILGGLIFLVAVLFLLGYLLSQDNFDGHDQTGRKP